MASPAPSGDPSVQGRSDMVEALARGLLAARKGFLTARLQKGAALTPKQNAIESEMAGIPKTTRSSSLV